VYALIGQEIDVAFGLTEAAVVESFEPFGHLRFGFDRTPSHSSDAIGLSVRRRSTPALRTLPPGVGAGSLRRPEIVGLEPAGTSMIRRSRCSGLDGRQFAETIGFDLRN